MGVDAISLEELRPEVRLAGYWTPTGKIWHRYCVPGMHLILLVDGRLDCRTPFGRFSAVAGDLIAFRAADLNEYGHDDDVAHYQTHVLLAPPPRDRLPLSLGPLGLLPERLPLGDRLPQARRCFETLCLELAQTGPAQRARVTAAFWQILALACEALQAQTAKRREVDAWDRARALLGADLGRPVEIARLAKDLGVSADHFTRVFRSRFGVSPVRYRAEALLRHAAEVLVSERDLPIKALARRLGFADDWSFSRAFRRHFGILPTEVREGTPLAAGATDDGEGLRPNRHIVPGDFPADWIRDYHPRG